MQLSRGDEALLARLSSQGEAFLAAFEGHGRSRAAVRAAMPPAAVTSAASTQQKRQGQTGPGAVPAGRASDPPSTTDSRLLKGERKRFLTGGGGGPVSSAPAARSSTERQARQACTSTPGDGPTREEFLEMQREVHTLGATALDKKSKRVFQAQALAAVGVRAEAGPRVPPSIGLGMAQKKKQREARALDEAVAAGMVQQKGMGKKKRRLKTQALDGGLREDGGAFRGGILHVGAPRRR